MKKLRLSMIMFTAIALSGCGSYGTFYTVGDRAIDTAENFIGVPYELGGQDQLGIDCSGLVVLSLNLMGVSGFYGQDGLTHDDVNANDLLKYNTYMVSTPERGDLVGFYNDDGFYHVAFFDSFVKGSIMVLDASEAGEPYVEYRVIDHIEDKRHEFRRLYDEGIK